MLLLSRHNSYARIIETGTEGLEFTHSQPMAWLPFVIVFYIQLFWYSSILAYFSENGREISAFRCLL